MVLNHLLFARNRIHDRVSPRRGPMLQLSKYPVNGDEAIPTRQAVGGRDRDDFCAYHLAPATCLSIDCLFLNHAHFESPRRRRAAQLYSQLCSFL